MADRDQMDGLFVPLSAESAFVYDLFGISAVTVDFEGDSNNNWMDRYDPIVTGSSEGTSMGGAYVAWTGDMYHGVQLGWISTTYASYSTGARVVADATQPVPEPATMPF